MCVAIMGKADGKFAVEVEIKCGVKIAFSREWDTLYIGLLRSEAEFACALAHFATSRHFLIFVVNVDCR